MQTATIATLVLALFVGVAVGLLGGGGSILMVPILTFVAGWSAPVAIAASLFVVGVTSLFSMSLHARKGNVRWKPGLLFGSIAMIGAFVGGWIAEHLSDVILMTMFAVVMLASGIGMIRKRKDADERDDDAPIPWLRVALAAVAIGLISGLVGAGGGFLIVPALVLLLGFPMSAAVGTSLLVIAMQSASGFASHMMHTAIDWPFVLAITGIAIIGAIGGVALVDRIPAATLRKLFGYFVIVMAGFVFYQELVLR